MQCQAQVELTGAVVGVAGAGTIRCPQRAVSAFGGKFLCRRHLALALGELRGEDAAVTAWWEIRAAETAGRCPFCGMELTRLERPRQTLDGALAFYEPCPREDCRTQRTAAYRAAAQTGAFLEE